MFGEIQSGHFFGEGRGFRNLNSSGEDLITCVWERSWEEEGCEGSERAGEKKMLESVVYQVLAGYLGHYVKDMQREQFRIGLWSGASSLSLCPIYSVHFLLPIDHYYK